MGDRNKKSVKPAAWIGYNSRLNTRSVEIDLVGWAGWLAGSIVWLSRLVLWSTVVTSLNFFPTTFNSLNVKVPCSVMTARWDHSESAYDSVKHTVGPTAVGWIPSVSIMGVKNRKCVKILKIDQTRTWQHFSLRWHCVVAALLQRCIVVHALGRISLDSIEFHQNVKSSLVDLKKQQK